MILYIAAIALIIIFIYLYGDLKENFWYDINRLGECGDPDGEFNLKTMKKIRRGNQQLPVEGFGSNRAPTDWNEKDYPIVTSNGLNLSSSFPQEAKSVIYDSNSVIETISRTITDHHEKN
jgi:hypothetical protein